MSADVHGLGLRAGTSEGILKGDRVMTVTSKFGSNRLSSFKGDDF